MTDILFIEFPDLHFHLDLVIDSVYIAGSFRFRFYFFFRRDFAIPLTHPLFDPSVPYIAIRMYMAHPFPPLTAVAATVVPPVSPHQRVPSISLSDDDDPSEATSFSSSTAPVDGYAPADASVANGFLSSESI